MILRAVGGAVPVCQKRVLQIPDLSSQELEVACVCTKRLDVQYLREECVVWVS